MTQLSLVGFQELEKRINILTAYVEELASVIADLEART